MTERRVLIALTVAVVTIMLSWILITPIAGGPDEPAHLVRAAAVARGQIQGTEVPDATRPGRTVTVYEVPPWLAIPTPCFALDAHQPAACAPPLVDGDETILRGTSARDYPIWGHLLPGFGTYAPSGNTGVLAARLLSAALPALLVVAGLVSLRRQRALRFATGLLALTPMAWFTFAVVNPSAPTIAGGFALWVGLLSLTATRPPTSVIPRGSAWLIATGWAALVLPRRDGLIWAALVVLAWALMERRRLIELWRSLGRAPQLLVAVSTVITIVWAVTTDSRVTRALVVVPVGLAAAELLRERWRTARPGRPRALILGVGAALAVIGAVGVVALRPEGMDIGLLTRIINDTGRDLHEAIGWMGWLDAPLPLSMVLFYALVLGMLAGVALGAGGHRVVVAAAGVLLAALVASWVLELYSGNITGTYWQGRYYLPLLMGIPLLFGAIPMSEPAHRRWATGVAVSAAVVVNAGFWSAGRRWGVGIHGSVWPWDWDTYGAFVPPVIALLAHLAAWVGLIALVRRR